MAVFLLGVSVLFIAAAESAHNLQMLGRTLAGSAFGITLPTVLFHTADNANHYVRRYLLWTLAIVNVAPTVLLAELLASWNGSADIAAAIGWLMLGLTVLALILMPCVHESAVFALESGKDLQALGIMMAVRNQSRHFIRNDFAELKLMIAEDFNAGANILRQNNWKPLILLLMLRLLSPLLSNNIVSSIALMNIWLDYQKSSLLSAKIRAERAEETTATLIETTTLEAAATEYRALAAQTLELTNPPDFAANETNQNTSASLPAADSSDLLFIHSSYVHQPHTLEPFYVLIFIFLCKVLVGLPLMCHAERLYIFRNRFVLRSALVIATLNIIFFSFSWISFVFDDSTLIFTYYMFKLHNIVSASFVMVAFGVDVIGYNELAEGFSLAKRFASIALIFAIEYLMHLLYILPLVLVPLMPFYLHFLHWAAIIGVCIVLLTCMPNDGLDKTLRQARDKYFTI